MAITLNKTMIIEVETFPGLRTRSLFWTGAGRGT